MKKILLVFCFLLSVESNAETKDSLVKYVKDAVELAKKDFESACKRFNLPESDKNTFWRGKELYIFVYNYEGKVLCHGAKNELIGKNLISLKSADGQFIIAELVKAAKSGGGFLEYSWEEPSTKKISKKLGYALPVDKDKIWLGSGIYTK